MACRGRAGGRRPRRGCVLPPAVLAAPAATAPSAARTGARSPSAPSASSRAQGELLGVPAPVLEHGERDRRRRAPARPGRVGRGRRPAACRRRTGTPGVERTASACAACSPVGGASTTRSSSRRREQRVEVGHARSPRAGRPRPARPAPGSRSTTRRRSQPGGSRAAARGSSRPGPRTRPARPAARTRCASGATAPGDAGSSGTPRAPAARERPGAAATRSGRPMSYDSAGTSRVRTTRVSSSTPNATMNAICARNSSGMHRQRGERRRQHDAGAGDHAAGHREPAQHAAAGCPRCTTSSRTRVIRKIE